MAKKNIEEVVSELAQPVAEQLNLELVDVEFIKEGSNWYLRIYIDKEAGIDVEDCRAVSHQMSELLDQHDPITQAYFLEVSSPGLDRPLKKPQDFEKYRDHLVKVTTFAPINGQKSFIGKLMGLQEDGIHLGIKGEKVVLPKDKVASIRLEVEF